MVTRESKDGQEKKCSGLRGDLSRHLKKRTKDLGWDIELFLAETWATGIQQEMSVA